MPDVAPHRLHISRHYGVIRSTERPARRMGDLWRQVSWLAAQASFSDLPDPQRERQWHMRKRLTAYSCGSSLGIGAAPPCAASHRVPIFIRLRANCTYRNRHTARPQQLQAGVNCKSCRQMRWAKI